MSGAPFRDLFAELPIVLFDALKLIGEEAVKSAEYRRGQYNPSPLDALGGVLCARYGWRNAEMSRSAIAREVHVGVRWPCMHKQVLVIEDSAFEDSPASVIDSLDELHDLGRGCYCVQHDR